MLNTMTHQERVLATLEHREPDRVPIDFCSNPCTAIHRKAYEQLRGHLGIGGEPRLMHRWQQIVDVGEEIKRRFEVDFRGVFLGKPDTAADVELGEGRYRDQWGVATEATVESLL